jgi:hypothetical protein
MQDALDALVHDAASLYGFVDFIHLYCKQKKNSQTYVEATGEFFSYIEKLASGTKDFLSRRTASATPARANIIRPSLVAIKDYWRLLHTFIKPAADAHTLTIPSPLIVLATQQVRSIPGLQNANVVVLLTPELMYFQTPHTNIKHAAIYLAETIPEARFPSALGFVELPYSQGPSFFNNLVLYHEIGHFVYEELRTANPQRAELTSLADKMISCLERNFKPNFRSLSQMIKYI